MSIAAVFPGQGSQKPGMGEGLFERYAELVAQANEILGYDLAELCLHDPDQQLNQTQFTQPALYTVNALTWYAAREEGMEAPACFAGHSLGEYNALLAAEVFDFATGLRLVRQRGLLMSEVTGGGMAAIIGLGADEIEAILAEHQLDSIDIANLNSPKQVVISGPAADVKRAQPAFENAKMFVPLKVSGAFHSRYMADVAERFRADLDRADFRAPTTPVIANVTGQPYEHDKVADLLQAQIDHSVRWTDSVLYMKEQGVETFKELGPGKVLSGLIRQIR